MDETPEGFPFWMNDEDIKFFQSAGFHHVSMAEVRRFGEFGKQTISSMVANKGWWTAHYCGWEGPKALTCQAAFVAAELAEWGGQQPAGLEGLAARLRAQRARAEFKRNFTG